MRGSDPGRGAPLADTIRAAMSIETRLIRRALVGVVAFFLAADCARASTEAQWSLRLGAGRAASRDTVLADTGCLSTAPPALFGCGVGIDGRPFSAAGDFGRGTLGEIAIGARLSPSLRLEVAALALRGFELDANANFPRVGAVQPVTAKLDSEALLAIVSWEPAATFGWNLGRLAPFVSAGIGGARHHLGAVTFGFPVISGRAVTVTRGGSETEGAWLLGIGAGIAVSRHATLEVALRRLDLGGAETEAGLATIVRPSRTFTLRVAAIRAPVRVDALTVGLRLTR